MMFCRIIWSVLLLSTPLSVVWSKHTYDMKTCPRECQCTAMNMVYMYCGNEAGFKSMTSFPSSIPNHVEILSLYRNKLTDIPEDALRNLTHLKTLNLRSNRLRDLPSTVFRDLVKLRSFNAGINKLSTLPGRLFDGLIDLQELYLDNNALESIPDELFQNLPSLKRLHLHNNKLKTFPGNAFQGTFSLQGLSLANNFLTGFGEETFSNVSSLRRLILTSNRIASIPVNLFSKLSSLAILRLENNNISSIHIKAFAGLKAGIFVLLSGNPFYCDCELRWLKEWMKTKAKYVHSRFRLSTTCSQPGRLKGKPLLHTADDQFTCVDGQWTEWSQWSACSATCGSGTRVSTRRCENPPPGRGGGECKGESNRTKSCHGPDCGAKWTSWSEWSECSKTCSFGYEVRARSCQHSSTASCRGTSQELRLCTRQPCSVDGKWGSWSRWSPCSVTCSWGTRVRTRNCDNPRPRYGGKPCPDIDRSITTEICYLGSCPVHGGWSAWSSWSSCTASCSTGTILRYRICNNPVPRYGGKTCNGNSTQQLSCNSQACPINGGWSDWSQWSYCSRTCSSGSQVRFRTCSNPSPQHGGQSCPGNSSDFRYRDFGPCPVHGHWATWSQWSVCSKTCANGTRSRNRTCSDPSPQHGGQSCAGNSSDVRYCGFGPCPLDGHWATWSHWSICSRTCADGTRSRNRTCSSPFPQFGGKTCSGQGTEIKPCNVALCPVDGIWSTWSRWSDCTKSCSGGRKSRTRTCSNPLPSNGGKMCAGNISETEECQDIPCPIHGGWGEWSNWTVCTKTCSNGTKSRYRNCNNPLPQYGGNQCSGPSSQSKECSQQPCPVVGEWTEWSNWTDCSKTCDVGQKTRTRSCKNPNRRSFESARDNVCTGNETDMRVCYQGPCRTQSGWNAWSSWSQCSVSCGLGKQERFRNCNKNEGDFCLGSEMQVKSCYQKDCPVNGGWNSWSNWTECSASCGTGVQAKFRFCINPKPQGGGDSCQGKNIMVKSCMIAECKDKGHQNDSFWSPWTSWSQCSTTCSRGYRTRSRYCRKQLSPFHLGNCSGATGPVQVESNICKMQPCASWSRWSTWGACSQSCGGGIQKRARKCKRLIIEMTCQGDNSQAISCNTNPCPPVIPPVTYPPKITLGLPNECPDPEKPLNGYYKITNHGGSFFVTYYCRKRYFVHGPRLRHCESDGSWSAYVPYCLPVCGESSFTHTTVQHQRLRIFGGGASLPGLWPWQVALTVNGLLHCGGSLIAEDWVVTAAHCIYHRLTRKRYSKIKVHLGVHDITSEMKDPHVQRIDSKEIVAHPNFNWRTFDSDLALIQLKWKANITDYVRPVCLPNKQQRRKVTPGAMGVMLGWGLTEGDKPTAELRQVYMPVVGHSNCQKAYEKEAWPVTSNMLCAGYASNTKDSCKRDSGGGFLFSDSKPGKKKKWFLGGIISWGNPRCGTPGKYSVFTHINSRFSRWIKNYIYN